MQNYLVMNPPVFILGNPRSGTTMLRLMLNNHKNIVIPPECGFAVWFYEKYQDRVIDRQTIEEFMLDLAGAKKIETWRLEFEKLQGDLLKRGPENYGEMVSFIYEYYGRSIGRNFLRWGDKNNFYIQHVSTIKKMLPSARLIHIVRDGRDVACSYRAINRSNIQSKYAPHLPHKIEEIAFQWLTNLRSAINAFEKIGWQNVYEIRYEDLTLQPAHELKKLCTFLDEPYDPNMESYYIKNQVEQQEPVEFLQWKAKTLERPTTSQVGRYLAELADDELEEFEQIALPMLHRYNYLV